MRVFPCLCCCSYPFFLSWVRFLRFLATRDTVAPRHLIDLLSLCVDRFPHNGYFWSIFSSLHVHRQLRFTVRRRLAAALAASASAPSSVPLWHFAISTELRLADAAHSTRALLERAVGDVRSRTCASLWKIFVKWELEVQQRPDLAKDVLLRALRECPGSKGALVLLVALFGSRKLTHCVR